MATDSTASPGVSRKIVANFQGISRSEIKKLRGVAGTPDPNGCVDGKYFHELVNGSYTRYFKDSGKIESRVTDSTFWANAGTSTSYLFDPRLLFVDSAGTNNQGILFACQLSSYDILVATNDPYQGSVWKGTSIRSNDVPDLPRVGYDTKSLSIVVSSGQHYDQQIYYFPRYAATSIPPMVSYAKTFKYTREQAGETLHPVLERTVGYPNRRYAFYIGVDTSSKIGLSYGWLDHGNLDKGLAFGRIPVSGFEFAVNRAHQPGDPGVNPSLVFGGQGIVTPPWRFGDHIWVVHHTLGASQSIAIRWYRLKVNENAQWPLSLEATGYIDSPLHQYDFFNGSIIQVGENVVICCNRSGRLGTPTDPNDIGCGNAGVYAIHLQANGQGHEVEIIRAGRAPNYTSTFKWGDYSTVCLDPADPNTVWMTNQLVLKGGSPDESDYATQIAAIKF
jgi:hypothetical protein